MSNGAQESPSTGTGSQGPGGAWIGLAALGSAIGLVASQYFPLVGGTGAMPWQADRLILIPLHVVLIGGLMGLAGWARGRPSVRSRSTGAIPDAKPDELSPSSRGYGAPEADVRASSKADDTAVAADSSVEENKPPEAITKPPPPKPVSIPPEGIPTAQRLEIAQMAALDEEEDRTLVGDLSELAKAQELAELQRIHREAKKAEQAKQAAKKGEK